MDDDSNKLKFGIFDKNKWTIEKVVEWDSRYMIQALFLIRMIFYVLQGDACLFNKNR